LRSGALQSRGRNEGSIRNDPGSAKQHFVLHRARETGKHIFKIQNFKQPRPFVPAPPRELDF
jgi:hypothetical protein